MSEAPSPRLALDVVIVTYRSDSTQLERLLDSLASQEPHPFDPRVVLIDNTSDRAYYARLAKLAAGAPASLGVRCMRSWRNVGFGRAVNRVLRSHKSPFVLLVNPDAYLAPDALREVGASLVGDEGAGAWEMRQSPFEHPKVYDPVTRATPWVSTAAVVFRRAALDAIGRFDRKIFLYGEDVDVSWRMRCLGWTLRYVPRAVAVHHTYAHAGEVKPVQILRGHLTNLCLRARFARIRRVAGGVRYTFKEMRQPEAFPGRNRGLAMNLVRFAFLFPRFRIGWRWRNVPGFQPYFVRWDYAPHRDGAFFEFREPGAWRNGPLVSILIRTHRRPQWLREALISVRNQTYPNIEVVIVEDGEPVSRAMVEREFASMDIRYTHTGEPVGRSRAGNLAMSLARGEWLNFLDDDDALFADHVEVMVQEAQRTGLRGVYGNAFETPTRVLSPDPLAYEVVEPFIRYRQRFSRLALWHHDYIPIQSLLFHRSLFEEHGGFEEDMDQLEDWNLWTRYTLREDFAYVPKTTSIYRVPVGEAARERQAKLDRAYADALRRQEDMPLAVTPREVGRWLDQHEGRSSP